MTLRLRLTLLYGGCFLLAGGVLLGITYALVAQSINGGNATSLVIRSKQARTPAGAQSLLRSAYGGNVAVSRPVSPGAKSVFFARTTGEVAPALLPPNFPRALRGAALSLRNQAQAQVVYERKHQLAALLTKSGIALVIMAFASIGLGWVVAGRALRPLRTMSARARRITEHNLYERLALEPRSDELGELAQTFDGLLGRLDRAFQSQRRFVANASHELRTPVTLERALIEVALSDPDASIESLRECCERVLAAGEQQERLIEALLTLARSQAGIEAHESVDLAAVSGELVSQRQSEAPPVAIEARLEPGTAVGDAALIERLVANLLDNAIAYNVPDGGWVRIWTGLDDGRPTVRVVNTGRAVPEDRVAELFEPFRRLNGDRTAERPGHGLGLSIVSAIATAHRAALQARPRADGGLEVEVAFPAPS
jgi:signal transduction histidine kinase